MDKQWISHSAQNILFFASRSAKALYRRSIGHKYLRDHPGLKRKYNWPNSQLILSEIRQLAPNLEIQSITIDRYRFQKWIDESHYPLLAYHAGAIEKYLEHFISVELLGKYDSGLLIDVASWRSFFPTLMRRAGYRVIVQDLVYREGLHDDTLGCNAASFPLPDESVDAMTLHCSFEHFEDRADIGFLNEASRLLKPGGKAVIIPLYLNEMQLTWVDPYYLARNEAPHEAGAIWQPAIGYSNRFGRMYSPTTFVERIVNTVRTTRLSATLWTVERAVDISPDCYLQFALVLEKNKVDL